eukprot:scaffold13307_cov97-Isochrysis_galbana.AAC.6
MRQRVQVCNAHGAGGDGGFDPRSSCLDVDIVGFFQQQAHNLLQPGRARLWVGSDEDIAGTREQRGAQRGAREHRPERARLGVSGRHVQRCGAGQQGVGRLAQLAQRRSSQGPRVSGGSSCGDCHPIDTARTETVCHCPSLNHSHGAVGHRCGRLGVAAAQQHLPFQNQRLGVVRRQLSCPDDR